MDGLHEFGFQSPDAMARAATTHESCPIGTQRKPRPATGEGLLGIRISKFLTDLFDSVDPHPVPPTSIEGACAVKPRDTRRDGGVWDGVNFGLSTEEDKASESSNTDPGINSEGDTKSNDVSTRASSISDAGVGHKRPGSTRRLGLESEVRFNRVSDPEIASWRAGSGPWSTPTSNSAAVSLDARTGSSRSLTSRPNDSGLRAGKNNAILKTTSYTVENDDARDVPDIKSGDLRPDRSMNMSCVTTSGTRPKEPGCRRRGCLSALRGCGSWFSRRTR